MGAASVQVLNARAACPETGSGEASGRVFGDHVGVIAQLELKRRLAFAEQFCEIEKLRARDLTTFRVSLVDAGQAGHFG